MEYGAEWKLIYKLNPSTRKCTLEKLSENEKSKFPYNFYNRRLQQFLSQSESVENEKIIDDFALASVGNLSFYNGLNVFIEKPKDDRDALEKGFELCHIDREDEGRWEILAAKDIVIEEVAFRAVLYGYQSKKYVAVYKKEKRNKYYFRVYNSTYYQGNSRE